LHRRAAVNTGEMQRERYISGSNPAPFCCVAASTGGSKRSGCRQAGTAADPQVNSDSKFQIAGHEGRMEFALFNISHIAQEHKRNIHRLALSDCGDTALN
jgi:hypothetical protein